MPRSTKKAGLGTDDGVVNTAAIRLAATTWLSDSTLLMVGSFDRADGPIDEVFLLGDDRIQLHARWSTYHSNELGNANTQAHWLILAYGTSRIRQSSGFGLSLASDAHSWQIDAETVASRRVRRLR